MSKTRKRNRSYTWGLVVVFLLACTFLPAFLPEKASAESNEISKEYIEKRSLYQGLKGCYASSLSDSIFIDSGGSSTVSVHSIFNKNKPYLYMPTKFGDAERYSCNPKRETFFHSAETGIMTKLTDSVPLESAESRDAYFEGMGFDGSNSHGGSSADKEVCVQYEYAYSNISGAKSNQLCFKSDSDGRIIEVSNEGGIDTKGGAWEVTLAVGFEGKDYATWSTNCSSGAICVKAYYYNRETEMVQDFKPYSEDLDLTDIDSFVFFLQAATEDIDRNMQFYSGSSTFSTVAKTLEVSNSKSVKIDNDTYKKTERTTADRAIAYLKTLNNINTSDFPWGISSPFNDTELYFIYITYLKDIYSAKIAYNFCGESSQGEAYIPIVMKDDDGNKVWKYCAIDNKAAVESMSTKVRTGSTMQEEKKAKDVVGYLQGVDTSTLSINYLPADQLNASDAVIDNPEAPTEGQNGKEAPVTCANSGGAKSLGWIICPILEWMSEAATDVYDSFLEPSLQVSASLFDEKADGQSTKKAWTTFQNIANLCFAILFVVVIFSQLTGIGIDNYGIKKILPKLIIAAVLINLSYYICVIAVDLSNILGSGFQKVFDGLAGSMPSTGTISYDGESAELTFATTALTAIAILGVIVVGGAALLKNPAVLLSVFIAGLGIIISVFFLYILLVAREAAILVLTVISPVAFVCYMLPNTKKLFDKWVQMSKGLLLVYPIAGLLVGGGNFISKLLLSAGFGGNGFASALSAMIVGIVPIFFIPTVLKGSFAAMGNLGAKISGVGKNLRGGFDKRTRNSDWYKNSAARMASGMNSKGELGWDGKVRAKIGKSRFANSGVMRAMGWGAIAKGQSAGIAASQKITAEEEKAQAMLMNATARTGISKSPEIPNASGSGKPLFGAGSLEAYYGGRFLSAAASGNVSGMNAALSAMSSAGMKQKDIDKVVRHASRAGGELSGMGASARSAWYRDIAQKGVGSTDYELQSFAQSGGTGNGGKLGEYGEYAASNAVKLEDIKPEDMGKLSGDSLAGMITSGKIDQSMAQRTLASNPNLSPDKKVMLGAAANGATFAGGFSDAAKFKEDATKLLSESFSGGPMNFYGVSNVGKNMRDAWTSVNPQEVNVVQNFQSGGRQYAPVDTNVSGGTINEIQVVHDVEKVTNVANVEGVQTVNAVNNVDNVSKVQNVGQIHRVKDVNNVGNVRNVQQVHNIPGAGNP